MSEKQLAEQINVVCLYCGSGYDYQYVQKLNSAVHKHLQIPFKFTVFTDKPELTSSFEHVVILPKFDYRKPWWYKLWLFSEDSGLQETILYFDLDVVLIKPIDVFVPKKPNLHILRDFNRAHRHKIDLSNSSIMSWRHEDYRYMWPLFNSNPIHYMSQYHGDQDFIHRHAKNKVYYDDKLTSSYKWEFLRKKNYSSATRAIVFHGEPKPHQVKDEIIVNNWCY